MPKSQLNHKIWVICGFIHRNCLYIYIHADYDYMLTDGIRK